MMKNVIKLCFIGIFILLLGSSAKAQEAIDTKDTTITIKVKGITCPNDCSDIAVHVKSEQGIKDCTTVGKPSAVSKFEITYNPKLISYNDVIKAIEETPGCENPNDRPYKVKGEKKK